MSLVFVDVMLIALGIYAIYKALEPKNPPVENMDVHLQQLMFLPNPKARQKFLKRRARQARRQRIEARWNQISEEQANSAIKRDVGIIIVCAVLMVLSILFIAIECNF